jgi:hypothetical protein
MLKSTTGSLLEKWKNTDQKKQIEMIKGIRSEIAPVSFQIVKSGKKTINKVTTKIIVLMN